MTIIQVITLIAGWEIGKKMGNWLWYKIVNKD